MAYDQDNTFCSLSVDSDQSHTNNTWTVVCRLVFPGTDKFTPNHFDAVCWIDDATAGRTGDVRLYDSTNSQVIAGTTGFNNTTGTIHTDSAVMNLPTGPAIFSVQTRRQNGTNTVHFHGGGLR